MEPRKQRKSTPWNKGIKMPRRSLEDRFWEKVDKRSDSECWEWKAYRDHFGYGVIGIDGYTRDTAHRVSFKLHGGVLEKGDCVLHRCDNPPCVNPAHLFKGTLADNVADKTAKGRTHKLKGDKSGKAKLTWEQVRRIRTLYLAGETSIANLAQEYNVSQTCIYYIVQYINWKEEAE